MTENLTNDKPKSTSTTTRSKASSTEPDEAQDVSAEAPALPDLTDKFPGYISKRGGFASTVAAIEAKRKELKLTELLSKDYRFVLGMPGGIPVSLPVTVIYKPESPQEQVLGTYRIGR